MALLKEMGNGQGFLKAGFLGFPKSGKTHTATQIAIGIWNYFACKKPIAFYDTEGGTEYIAKDVLAQTGKKLVGIKSRAFSDLVAVTQEIDKEGIEVLIVDSITHPWRELCDGHLKAVNAARVAKGQKPRNSLEMRDWGQLKGPEGWAKWADWYLNSKCHVIICGRAGFEYEHEKNEETGRTEIVKSGTKMKTESEFGFEPSLLIEMEQVRGEGTKKVIHRATVLGDRFNVIDGRQFDDPTFESFIPHIKLLKPGNHSAIDMTIKSDTGSNEDGDAEWFREKREREILREEIQGEIVKAYPGQTAAEKKAKVELIEKAFGTTSWAKVETMHSTVLRTGLSNIKALILAKPVEAEVAK